MHIPVQSNKFYNCLSCYATSFYNIVQLLIALYYALSLPVVAFTWTKLIAYNWLFYVEL